ncbi:MAG: TonB-dependent receptor [Bacteroidales bacterium]|nr:TonB-dependent receptor [Bacteroidales bacterium]
MRRLFILLSLLVSQAAFSQNKNTITVSGLITDAVSGETLIGAGATVGKDGAVTNNFGFYSLSVPAKSGKTDVTYSYVGYTSLTISVPMSKDTVVNVTLVPGASLEEAVITAQKESGIEATKMSAIEVPIAAIKSAPALFGEADVLKTIQMLPGVQGGTEGFSGLYVRGGGPDENLLLLDGIPVYNAEHMLGIFSIFQPEAVKKITLYKGAFPARYGGRISSILDVRTNDGNMYETHGSFGVSMISDKLHLEGPLWKGKTSYSVSGRGMHSLLLTPILKLTGFDGNYFFYDLNAKLTHRFSDRDRLYFNVYNGLDDFYYKSKDDYGNGMTGGSITDTQNLGIRWGNTVAALRWNHVMSPKLFANTTVAYNRYKMKMGSDLVSQESRADGTIDNYQYNFDYRSGMRDWVAKVDFDYTPTPSQQVKFGAGYTFHTFIPETLTTYAQESSGGAVQLDTTITMKSNGAQIGHEVSLYVEDDIRLGNRLTLNPGVHASLFGTQGKTYWSLEPRMSAKLNFTPDWAVKASYSRMSQYVHLLSSSQLSLPVDLWVPITKNIRPETSNQYSLGLYYNGIPGWEFSLEGYYKSINNVLEYKEGVAFLFDSSGWENKVEVGSGRAMGLELFIEKTMGRTTGWLGYTLAKSDRLFPTINHGERFSYRYDRRHNVNLVLNHRLNEKFDFSATWNYASGGATTLPERRVAMISPSGEIQYTDFVTSRNNYRLPSSHTLNLGFNFHKKHNRGEGIWNLSVYNAYNRMNPSLVLKSNSENEMMTSRWDGSRTPQQFKQVSEVQLKKITLLPFFPSVGYTRTF